MAEYVEVDVRGLSCPEPVLLTMDAMQDHPGKLIRVLGDEAHTRKNIEKMLEYENKSGQTTVRPDGCFEIVFQEKAVSGTHLPHHRCRHGDGVVLQTEWHCRSAGAGAAQTVRRMRHRVAHGSRSLRAVSDGYRGLRD